MEEYRVLICDETEELSWVAEWLEIENIPYVLVKADIQIYKIMRMPMYFSHICMKKEQYDCFFGSVEECIGTRGMLVIGERFSEFYDGAEVMCLESDSKEVRREKLDEAFSLGKERILRKGTVLSLRKTKEHLDYGTLIKNPSQIDLVRVRDLLSRLRYREIEEAYQIAEAYLMECSHEIAFFLKKIIAKMEDNDYNGACEICEKMMEIRLLNSLS